MFKIIHYLKYFAKTIICYYGFVSMSIYSFGSTETDPRKSRSIISMQAFIKHLQYTVAM